MSGLKFVGGHSVWTGSKDWQVGCPKDTKWATTRKVQQRKGQRVACPTCRVPLNTEGSRR